MKPITQRAAIVCILVSVVLFSLALAAFCYSLGLDFTNEGWSQPSGDAASIVQYGWLNISIAGFAVSTVLFFVGVHRIART